MTTTAQNTTTAKEEMNAIDDKIESTIANIDQQMKKINNRSFFQRHSRKLKWTAYGVVAVGAVGAGYYLYKRSGGSDAELIEAATEVVSSTTS